MKLILALAFLVLFIYSGRCLDDDAKDAGPHRRGTGGRQQNGVMDVDTPPTTVVVDEAIAEPRSSLQDELKEKRSNHDKRMDQEAIVGGAATWKQLKDLTSEEADKQIRRLIKAMDKDHDDWVSKEELVRWLRKSGERALRDQTHTMFVRLDTDKNGFIDSEEFRSSPESTVPGDNLEVEKRFSRADLDRDGHLTEEELRGLVTPTHHAHMLEHLVDEQLSSYDTNQDGYIDVEEYVGIPSGTSDNHVPEWMERERSEFNKVMDKNGDGRLSRDEVREWLLSEEVEFLVEEAEHLIQSADIDEDGQLSVDEILAELDVFLDGTRSHAKFRTHEEL